MEKLCPAMKNSHTCEVRSDLSTFFLADYIDPLNGLKHFRWSELHSVLPLATASKYSGACIAPLAEMGLDLFKRISDRRPSVDSHGEDSEGRQSVTNMSDNNSY